MRSRLVLAGFILAVAAAPGAAQSLPPQQAKSAFLKLLDRPRVPAQITEDALPAEKNGLKYTHWSFASEKKVDGKTERVPVLMVAPAGKEQRRPVMIACTAPAATRKG